MGLMLINNQGPFRGTLQPAGEETGKTTMRTPDPTWWTTDRRGHYHAYGAGGGLPTLYVAENQTPPKDGPWSATYRCRLCREPVRPRNLTCEVLSDVTLCLTGVPFVLADGWIGREVSFMDNDTFGIAQYREAADSGSDKADVTFQVTSMGHRMIPASLFNA